MENLILKSHHYQLSLLLKDEKKEEGRRKIYHICCTKFIPNHIKPNFKEVFKYFDSFLPSAFKSGSIDSMAYRY